MNERLPLLLVCRVACQSKQYRQAAAVTFRQFHHLPTLRYEKILGQWDYC
jgi:hypothetical protein